MFNRVLKIKALVVLVIVAAFSAASYAQETGGLKGKVRTMSGNGIANATVKILQNGKELKFFTISGTI